MGRLCENKGCNKGFIDEKSLVKNMLIELLNFENREIEGRIYLPSASGQSADSKECLIRYVEREFPGPRGEATAVYSIPKTFRKIRERQATLAEQEVFNRLGGMQFRREKEETKLSGLWMIFFHSACYAGHSFRNRRVGKLMVREHDFVIFAKFQNKHFIALIEVKSTNDQNTTYAKENLQKISDSKVIKNNKRSAQHQLRDHMEILMGILEGDPSKIQCYIMWPFLRAYTTDPRHQPIKRWKEDGNLHVFEDVISDQDKFNDWFLANVLNASCALEESDFTTLLDRFIVLSCGVFVDEIDKGLRALLTQEQLDLLNNNNDFNTQQKGRALVVHGPAGTGKTLLVLRKLEQLHLNGNLNHENRALFICYWPGIRFEIEQKLELLGIREFVDTAAFYISSLEFLKYNRQSYKHIFMDEAEALCLAFDPTIVEHTLGGIYKRYHDGNCQIKNCPHSNFKLDESMNGKLSLHSESDDYYWGELWFMVDINQGALLLPRYAPRILNCPSFILTRVMRSTGYIFNAFLKQYYVNPVVSKNQDVVEPKSPKSFISIGHQISGPPVYWVESDDTNTIDQTLASVVIDLCSAKGVKPNDICVLPLIVSDKLHPNNINKFIDESFVENGFRPEATADVEYFVKDKKMNEFLFPWFLRVKGLEFEVVVIVIDEEDFDWRDMRDRNRIYIMSSRCTGMLIVLCDKTTKIDIDCNQTFMNYPFANDIIV